jgi:hypothetical protein
MRRDLTATEPRCEVYFRDASRLNYELLYKSVPLGIFRVVARQICGGESGIT